MDRKELDKVDTELSKVMEEDLDVIDAELSKLTDADFDKMRTLVKVMRARQKEGDRAKRLFTKIEELEATVDKFVKDDITTPRVVELKLKNGDKISLPECGALSQTECASLVKTKFTKWLDLREAQLRESIDCIREM